MRKSSIKLRLTLWYTLLMLLMAAVTLTFVLVISSSVANQTTLDSLDRALRENALQADLENGELQIGSGFSFYHSGVYTVIYSKSQALMAGQLPQAFTSLSLPFENGLTRPVDTEQGSYYVMDLWLPSGWEDGIWLRGMTEISQGADTRQNLLIAAGVALPALYSSGRSGRLVHSAPGPAAPGQHQRHCRRHQRGPGPVRQDKFWGKPRRSSAGWRQNFDQDAGAAGAGLRGGKALHLRRLPRAAHAPVGDTQRLRIQLRSLTRPRRNSGRPYRPYTVRAKKMSALINQLLQMTRLDQGTEKLNMELLDLSALAEELCRDQGAAGAPALLLILPPGAKVRGDRLLLVRLAPEPAWTTPINTANRRAVSGYLSAGTRVKCSSPSGTRARA